jgi:hypothetical protein
MRRDFLMTASETDFLNSLGLPWQALKEGSYNWLIVNNYPVPEGYNVSCVDVALMIPPGYPVTQIDMAYFFPHLARRDNKQIGALAHQIISGVQYQRWSRHRTASNPWRPGIDDVSTHLQLVNHWFEREIIKR